MANTTGNLTRLETERQGKGFELYSKNNVKHLNDGELGEGSRMRKREFLCQCNVFLTEYRDICMFYDYYLGLPSHHLTVD